MAQTITAQEFFEASIGYIGAQRWMEAIECLEKAILMNPLYPAAYNQRGNVLQQIGRHFDSVLNYNMAIGLDPNSSEVYNNRGAALQVLQDYVAALRDYKKALEINPAFEECLTNMGNVEHMLGNTNSSRAAYHKSIEVNPNFVDAHFNLACLELGEGNYEVGWNEYEWRWKTNQVEERRSSTPTWNGEDLTDKSILIYGEQGFGDVLQFIRYAKLLKDCGAKEVVAEVKSQLARIIKTVPGVDRVIIHGDNIGGPFDYNCALMGLPRSFKTTIDNIPADVPYVSFPESAAEKWKEKLSGYPGIKIGICWAGSPRPFHPAANAIDRRRSTNLALWHPLGGIPNTLFVSLQKDGAAEQGRTPPPGMTIANWYNELDDLTDTAALMTNLDLVITVDTAVVHLAGALGRPTWLLSRYDNCWRWLGRRQDSPWYPTVRQFIQPSPGRWEDVFEQVGIELRKFVIEKSRLSAVA